MTLSAIYNLASKESIPKTKVGKEVRYSKNHFDVAKGVSEPEPPTEYTKNDIRNIPLTEFMAALGEKPVKAFEDMKLYYAPQRDVPEPMLVVDTNTNR